MPTYRAVVMPGAQQPLRIDEFPSPKLEQGAALLHTLYSEVCGTDVHLHHGRLDVPFPIIPGHVSIGVVAELRGEASSVAGETIREGDVVTFLDVHETCDHCYHCLVARQPNRCPSRKVYGITYSARDGLLGGWSEAIWMKPGVKMLPFGASLDPLAFIGGGCGLVTALHATDLAAIRLGESVAVLGTGPVGQSAIAFSALSGAIDVIAIGAPEARVEFALRMGATRTLGLDTPPAERLSQVRGWTGGRGVDVVIEASGAPEALPQALDLVRDGGRVIIAGHYTDTGDVTVHPHFQINRKHVELRGCWGSRYEHFHRALALVESFGDRVPWREMVSGRYTLDQASEGLAAVEARHSLKALITPNPKLVA